MAGNPLTLNVGQTSTATVVGFDQFGNPFPIDFTVNPPAWTIDNAAVSIAANATVPTSEDVKGVSATGATPANLTVTCAGLSDTEQITVLAPAPVLTSLKVTFTPPA